MNHQVQAPNASTKLDSSSTDKTAKVTAKDHSGQIPCPACVNNDGLTVQVSKPS